MGSVYFIQAGNRPLFKIGSVKQGNIDSRLASLQTGCPYQLSVYAVLLVPEHIKVTEVERKLHRQLSEKRERGEWFKIGRSDVKSLILEHGELIEDHEIVAADMLPSVTMYYHAVKEVVFVPLNVIAKVHGEFHALALLQDAHMIIEGKAVIDIDILIRFFPKNANDWEDAKSRVIECAKNTRLSYFLARYRECKQ